MYEAQGQRSLYECGLGFVYGNQNLQFPGQIIRDGVCGVAITFIVNLWVFTRLILLREFNLPTNLANVFMLPERVVARISNAPKFMFKSDVLWYLKGCNLKPEDIIFMYDSKFRPKFVQAQFNSVESFRLAQRSLAMKGRFGGRYLKLTEEEVGLDEVNTVLQPFRGRSLLMYKIPNAVTAEDVERFFSGFTLDTNYPIKFLRLSNHGPAGFKRPSTSGPKPEIEMRALVRFRDESEALRALRERQGSYCVDKSVDLRFIV